MEKKTRRIDFEMDRGDRLATYREIRVAVTEYLKKKKATASPYIETGESVHTTMFSTLDYLTFGVGPVRDPKVDTPIPDFHWISCFAVPGGSEGHYIHVEAIDKDGGRTIILLGKTFHGFRQAYEIACEIAHFLYGYGSINI